MTVLFYSIPNPIGIYILYSILSSPSLRLKESPALAAKFLHKFDQALYEAENLEADPGTSRVSGNEAALWQVKDGLDSEPIWLIVIDCLNDYHLDFSST